MNYTNAHLERDVKDHETELAAIRKDRGERYGSEKDVLANVATFGWRGAVVSLVECSNRLIKAFKSAKPDAADICNAADDATNYSHYVKILLKRDGL